MKEIINMLKSIGVRKVNVKSMVEIEFKYYNRMYVLKIHEFKITITDKKLTFNFVRNDDVVELIRDFLNM